MKKLLKVKELAEILNVDPQTIYQWVKNSEANGLPFYDIGQATNQVLRFDKEKVMNWLDDCEN